MNLLAIFSKPKHTDRELIETRSRNIFLEAKAEASAIVAAEMVGRCMALEEQVHRISRPQRERRKDAAAVIAARRETTEKLSRVAARMRGMGGGR